MDDRAAQDRVARVETLLGEAEGLADAAAREVTTELARALLDLYGEGLARMVDQIAERDTGELAEALAADELVSHLLLLHGLHPVPLEARVREALVGVRPYLESHGGDVELLGVEEGVVRLRLEGSCSGCPSSAVTLKHAIEDAIHQAAPDVDRVEAEGASEPEPVPGLLPLQMAGEAPAPRRTWARAEALPEIDGDEVLVHDVAGEPLMFLRLGARLYAYRSPCPSCGASLGDGVLRETVLRCAGCGTAFDVRRAGRALDAPGLHLEPVPLLTDHDGAFKVAVGTATAA